MRNWTTGLLQALRPDRSSLGIEITDSLIKMTKVHLSSGKAPMIETYDSEVLPVGCVEEGRIKEPWKVTQIIQTMLVRMDRKSQRVHTVLPSQLVMVRFLKLPDIPLKDLTKLVDFEVKHNIHLPFDQPYYDFVRLNGADQAFKKKASKSLKAAQFSAQQEAAASKENPFDIDPTKGLFDDQVTDEKAEEVLCDVMLVIVPQEIINEYLNVFQSAKVRLTSMEIKAFSLLRLIQSTKQRLMPTQGTFLMVDVNATASDLSVFQGDCLKITRCVPLNFKSSTEANQLANEPSSSLDLRFAEFDEPNQVFTQTCHDLAHELERLMNFYRYTLNNRNQEFDGMMLAGDIERMPEVIEVLKERLTIPVHLFQTEDWYGRPSGIRTIDPAYAVPLGLALRGRQS
ncbi:Competence protein A [compost metagenome]